MGLLLGVIVYIVILTSFISFERFVKNSDKSLFEQLQPNQLDEKPAN